MWDQPHPPVMTKEEIRIIPTYVGSTGPLVQVERSATNHSHVCGINGSLGKLVRGGFESFPRMWDQLDSSAFASVRSRIIPTYVGSTEKDAQNGRLFTNHSHVCGINLPYVARGIVKVESFPRMWDQLIKRLKSMETDRIIPTYVGSTAASSSSTAVQTNHSHVCGINVSDSITDCSMIESFPRMWDQRSMFTGFL